MGSSRKINRTLHKVIQINGGSVIGQSGIGFGLPHLFRGDGVIAALRDVIIIWSIFIGIGWEKGDSS